MEQVNSRNRKTAGLSAHLEEAVSLSNRRLEGPRTGITPLTGLRIAAELNAKLDAWSWRGRRSKLKRRKIYRPNYWTAFTGDPFAKIPGSVPCAPANE